MVVCITISTRPIMHTAVQMLTKCFLSVYDSMILEKCILFTENKIVSSNSAYFFGLDIEINLSLLIFRGFIAFDDKEQFFLYCILDQT